MTNLNTKERILQTSLHLLNESGLKNTTLQAIASELGISVGNLAYHYKNKQEIISVLSNHLGSDLKECLARYRNYPGFLDMHLQVEQILNVQIEYSFVFTNLGEMKMRYPETFRIIGIFMKKLKTQFESRLAYQIERGRLRYHEKEQGRLLAENMATLVFCSPNKCLFEEEEKLKKNTLSALWFMLKPYLTTEGNSELDLLLASIDFGTW